MHLPLSDRARRAALGGVASLALVGLAACDYGPDGDQDVVAFVGSDAGTLAALDTRTGARLWTYEAPARTGCGPSIVDGRVLWGYGFRLFGPAGEGGVISFGLAR